MVSLADLPISRKTGGLNLLGWPGIVAMFAIILVAGLLSPSWLAAIGTVTIARALVVLGLLAMLRGGLISFGQGLYYCIGGYTVGALDMMGVSDFAVRIAAGAIAAMIVGTLVGFLVRRYRGIFFAMLSLALSMLLYGVLAKNYSLGSTDGFNISSTTFFTYAPSGPGLAFSLFCGAVLVATCAALLVNWYFDTIVGSLAPALRNNELRIEYLGHSAAALVHFEYAMAATLAGVGGAIVAMATGIDPDLAYWTTSGDFVFVTILGGHGHVLAAFLGAAVYEVIHTIALWTMPQAWRMIIGLALLVLILKMPGGLWTLLGRKP